MKDNLANTLASVGVIVETPAYRRAVPRRAAGPRGAQGEVATAGAGGREGGDCGNPSVSEYFHIW